VGFFFINKKGCKQMSDKKRSEKALTKAVFNQIKKLDTKDRQEMELLLDKLIAKKKRNKAA
jgi:hypothetical protein